MKYLLMFFLIVGNVYSDEAFIQELDSHILKDRLGKEDKEYICSLSPESLNLIVDELVMDGSRRGRNDAIFSAALIHLRQLEKTGTSYDKKYVFEKLVAFARYSISKDKEFGGSFMNYFMGLEHPLVLGLANDLLESENEMTRDNAKRLIKRHEEKKRVDAQRRNSKIRDSREIANPTRNENEQASSEKRKNTDSKEFLFPQWIYIVAVLFFTIFGFLYVRHKT